MTRSVDFRVDDAGVARLMDVFERFGAVLIPPERTGSDLAWSAPAAFLPERAGVHWVAERSRLPSVRSRRQVDGTWAVDWIGTPALKLFIGTPVEGVSKAWIQLETSHWEVDGSLMRYPDDYERWATRILGWVRRNLR
jgi:hypothetical protein